MVTSQITLPAPRTWSPQDLVTVPRLRADLSDAAALLTQRPYFIAQSTTGESTGSGSDVTLTMDTTVADTWAGFSNPASNVYRCQLPGWYLVEARIPFNYTSSTPAQFAAGISSSDTAGGATAYGAALVNGSTSPTVIARTTDLVQMLTAGPSGTVTAVIARQNSGSTVALNAGAPDIPTVSMRWVCALSGTQPLPVPPLTAVPSPITSAWLNANLRDAISFLTYPPAARMHGASGSLASGSLASPTIINLSTVDTDNYGAWNGVSKWTAPVAGRYLVSGQVSFASSSTAGWYACGVLVNGTTGYYGGIVRFAGSSLSGGAAIVKRIRLNAGDFVQLIAVQSTGGSLAVSSTAGYQTRLTCLWEGK